MNPPKMPIHIGDYKRDTGHLRALLHGGYLLLLFHYWSTGGLPDDDDQLAAIACMTRGEWKRARPILAKFFADGWHHGRVEKDLAAARESYEKRAKAGEKGGKAKAEAKQSSSNATAGPKQPLTLDHLPDSPDKKDSVEARAPRDAPQREKVSRGTRLLDDWKPSEQDLAFARTQKLDDTMIETEVRKFRNYWTSKSGKDATKRDWSRTWENWILNVRQRGPAYGNRAASVRKSAGDDFFAGLAEVAQDIAGDGGVAGPGAEEIPLGRLNIDG